MNAYYNEIDPFAAAWLRELIRGGHIVKGDVDERDVLDVCPDGLRGYTQVHLFAGIGGWSYALRLAGWPDDRPVLTASCPCQPFSAAGKRRGTADERHLWPAAFHLIDAIRPEYVFGEQVASRDGLAWLDLVFSDLEGAGYAAGAVDLCAAGVGAPHIRQRLFFVAHATERARCGEGWAGDESGGGDSARKQPPRLRHARVLADTEQRPAERQRFNVAGAASGAQGDAQERERLRADAGDGGESRELADPEHTERRPFYVNGEDGRDGQDAGRQEAHGESGARGEVRGLGYAEGGDGEVPIRERGQDEAGAESRGASGPCNGFWSDAEWIACTDGKSRPVEPGTFPLATGVRNCVGLLRGYGNAIVPEAAAEVIRAVTV